MKTDRKRTVYTLLAVLFLTLGCLISCNQNADNDAEVEAMRARLNAIMLEHQQMQMDYENYASTLAQKDSAIQAQAREIERLLSELKVSQTSGGTGHSGAALKKKTSELKAKQRQIAELEERLAQQSKDLESMRQLVREANSNNETLSEGEMLTLGEMRQQLTDQDRLIAKLSNEKVVLTNRNDSLMAMVTFLTAHDGSVKDGDGASQVAELENLVSKQQEEITRLQAELNEQVALVAEAQSMAAAAKSEADANKKATAKAKGTVNQKLSELEAMCESYRKEIEQLRAENLQLRTENDSLRGEVELMQKNAEQKAEESAKLTQKVRKAAILVTRDVTVTPLKKISNNSGKETNRASAVNALKIDGTILDNNVVDPGTVVVYVCVNYPDGHVVSVPVFDARGNMIPYQEFEVEGTKRPYTFAHAIEFTGESRPFTMIWSKSDEVELVAGIYKVTLYANGNVIGSTTFRLK